MPMRKEAYPDNWSDISLRIRKRADWKCEQCGAPNGAWIYRLKADMAVWCSSTDYQGSDFDHTGLWFGHELDEWTEKETRVVLTVHHKGVDKPDGTPGDRHDKMDVRDKNLACLCQRCHFLADIDIHIIHARASRLAHKAARIAESGQMGLFRELSSNPVQLSMFGDEPRKDS